MNFYTLFTRTENVNLLKDVGLIPETLAKNYDEVNSYVVTYKNGDYSYVGKEITHLKLLFLNKRFGKILDGIRFIIDNSNNIDVLNIYHLNLSSYIYCMAAKLFLKRDSKIYLKLDANPAEIDKLRKHDLRAYIKKKTIQMADIVSGETSVIVEKLVKEVNPKIKLIPNGYYNPDAKMSDYLKKKNRIITVGRLGVEPKNTELLIDAFVKNASNHNWELRLIGPYTNKLKEKVDYLLNVKPELLGRIELVGEINDKKKLSKEYEEAKIFAFPSKCESFGLVLTEALMAGDYLLVSDGVPAAYDVIYSDTAGRIVKNDSLIEWVEAIDYVVNVDMDYERICSEGFRKANALFCWDEIVKRIFELL